MQYYFEQNLVISHLSVKINLFLMNFISWTATGRLWFAEDKITKLQSWRNKFENANLCNFFKYPMLKIIVVINIF